MKSSLRARRMARNHTKLSQQPKLNLVALMDIFTILVFFLMVNNGDVEVLQADNNIPLPESTSEIKPDIALTIKISSEAIMVQGRKVAEVAPALSQESNVIAGLAQELQLQSDKAGKLSTAEESSGREVIIMAEQHMPYQLLKRVMSTCAENDYRNISLAVNSAPAAPGTGQLQVAER
jgi:biopolymer transport protein ExbD